MGSKKRTPAGAVALGGVLAALAAVIMGMGTLIPVATYVCPMMCTILLQVVLKLCGGRNAWAWYGAVAFLGLLFAPDKEAAVIFCFLGYYPIVKPRLDRKRGKWLWKGLFFNVTILTAYFLLIFFLGLEEIWKEFKEMGVLMTVVLLLLGNVTFFLLDKLLEMRPKKRRGQGGT